MIDALIFDFDGVIIDTETPDYASWQEVFHSYRVELDRSLWTRLIGGGSQAFDVYQHLEDLAGVRIDRQAIRHRRRTRYLELVEASPLLPGIADYISEAKRMDLKLGVASSSSRDWVRGHLETRNLLGHFASVKGADDVSKVKPYPEVYLSSVADLGTCPNSALAIEDSPIGVTAAKRAGLLCVVVPNQMTKDLSLDHADMRLESLSDIPLKSLLSRMSQKTRTR